MGNTGSMQALQGRTEQASAHTMDNVRVNGVWQGQRWRGLLAIRARGRLVQPTSRAHQAGRYL
jgi:hypothetical protein